MVLKFLYGRQKYSTKKVAINGTSLSAIIADTTIKRMIGLMYRKGLKKNECMLFVFESSGYHSIWMQNMLFAIDVLWADEKGKIVDIKTGLKPCKSMFGCPTYAPKASARYLLELSKGDVHRLKIKVKQKIKFL